MIARSSRPGTPLTTVGSSVVTKCDLRRKPGGALDRVLDQGVEPDVRELELGRPFAGELHEARDEPTHLTELTDEVTEQRLAGGRREIVPAREHLDVRPDARKRRAELVRGVGDELSLLLLRLVERGEHRVEAGAEPGELVAAFEADAMREVARLGDRLRLARQPPHRAHRRLRDERAEGGSRGDSSERDEHEGQADPVEQPVHLLERPDQLERVPLADGHDQLADVRPLDLAVGEEGLPLARCCAANGVVHGEVDLAWVGLGDLPVLVHGLEEHVAARIEAAVRDVEDEITAPGVGADAQRPPSEKLGALLEGSLDLAAELVADEDVDEAGRERDRERDGRGSRDREPGAEAHGSRSA